MSIRKSILFGAIAAVLTGCSSYGPWTPTNQDAPWCGNHNRATTWRRTETPSSFMVVGAPLVEESWRANGKSIRTRDVSESINRYLDGIGYIDQQRKTNGHSDGIQERVAEHRFFIVSLQPTVVVMTPYKVGPTDGKTTHELAGRLDEHVLDSFPLVNGYHYGGRVVRSQEYKWFSPESKSGIQPARRDGSRWIIEDKNVRILITQATTGSWNSVDRQR